MNAINKEIRKISKLGHSSEAETKIDKFRRKIERRWSLLLNPFLYPTLILLIIPSYRRRFLVVRNDVRNTVKGLVHHYVPKIISHLEKQEKGFNSWGRGNADIRFRVMSLEATLQESEGRVNAERCSQEMLRRIHIIEQYNWYFHPIEDPTRMISYLHPGFLTTNRARNYCKFLIEYFA